MLKDTNTNYYTLDLLIATLTFCITFDLFLITIRSNAATLLNNNNIWLQCYNFVYLLPQQHN